MGEIRLTKDADALLCVLYKEYLDRRKNGTSKRTARFFGGSQHIQATLMTKWSADDVNETCYELSENDMLSCFSADNVVCESALTDTAIVYMENRFKDGLSTFFQHLEQLRALLPW